MLERMRRRISRLVAALAAALPAAGSFGCGTSTPAGTQGQDDAGVREATPGDGTVGDAGGRKDAAVNADAGTDSAPPADYATEAGQNACPLSVAGTLALPTSLVGGMLNGPSQNTKTSCGVDDTRGPEATYFISVPKQTGVTLTVAAMGRFVVAIRKMCDDVTTEVACKNGEPVPSSAVLRAELGPGAYWILVDGIDESVTSGEYTLSLQSNGTCDNAEEIVENAAGFGNAATVFGDLAGGEPSPSPLGCSSTAAGLGSILYFHASVPPSATLVAGARRSDVGEPLPINVTSSCSSQQCLADAVGQVRYSNVGAAATDAIIQVGSGSTSGSAPFELQVAIRPLAANAICKSPNTITPGMPIDDDTSLGGTTSLPCTGRSEGTLYYAITVPPGKSLAAQVTPVDPFDAHLVILDTCGASSCLASSQTDAGQAMAIFANASATPRPVIVAVSGGATVGRFTLNATLQ